jgi:dipeptidyl aminopeptidase/acylaminoacyl peptidase
MTPISAAAIARSRTLGEPRWSPDGTKLAWLDASGGRVDLVVAPADGSAPPLTVTAEVPVTPIGAYGGGGFCWASVDELVYAAADGRLVAISAVGGPVRVLCRDGRAAAPAVAPRGGQVAFVLERDDACDIAVVPLDASEWPVRVSRASYAWDPAWAPDGLSLAWHEWDLPNMPWDGSRIAIAAPGDRARVVAGGDATATGQPRFAPDGRRLAWVSDHTGWMNLWVAQPDGSHARPLLDEPCEHAEPSWGPGQRSFAWSPDGGALAINRNEKGFGRLVVVSADGDDVRGVSKGWHRGLDWGPGGLACVRSGARTAPQVTLLDMDQSTRRAIARGAPGELDAVDIPEPEPVAWTVDDGTTVHGVLWRAGTAPSPLLVDLHGGPTGQSPIDWIVRIRFFVSRGWAVLAPNHRGSTGYARCYERALDHQWGVIDVADTVAGIRAAGEHAWADASRAAVIGGSAGGFTTLLVAAHQPPVVRAAVSLYGVTDLFDLAATTHRFESRYLDRLVGVLPDHADRYRDRSPVTRARDVHLPVLVLQGDADKVVPPAQAQQLVDAMRAAGAPVEYHVYEGEGHGWSRPETIVDAYERIDAFLEKWVLQR